MWNVIVCRSNAANEKKSGTYLTLNVYWHFSINGCHCVWSPASYIQIPSSQASFLSSFLMLSSHIFVFQASAFEAVYISKSFPFFKSKSHIHRYCLDFTSITKYVTCVSDDSMDWVVKTTQSSGASVPLYSNYTFFYKLFIHYKAVRYLWISCKIVFILIFVTIPSKMRSQQINIANCHKSRKNK